MKFKKFDYDVFVLVEMSGHDLLFLRSQALNHYDIECVASAQKGGFLYGFFNRWIFDAAPRGFSLTEDRLDLDRLIEVKLGGRELGILSKICEVITKPDPRLKSSDFIQLLKQRKAEYVRICTKSTE